MPPRIPSRVRRFATAGLALVSGGLLATACSLNPQPLPPDQPTDASSGFGSVPQGAVDGGVNNSPGQPDATIPAVDSGVIPVAQDGAAPPNGGGGPDAGRSSDGGGVDGAHDGSDGGADATGDTSVATDGAGLDAGVSDGGSGDAAFPACPGLPSQVGVDAATQCTAARFFLGCYEEYCLSDNPLACLANNSQCVEQCMPDEYGMDCDNLTNGFPLPDGGLPLMLVPPPDAGCRLAHAFAGDVQFYCCSCGM